MSYLGRLGGCRILVLWLIAILSGSFYFLDWSRLFMDWPALVDSYMRASKFAVSVLATVLLLFGWQWKKNAEDAWKLLFAFIAINLGDLAFVAKVAGLSNAILSSIGMGVFLVAQLLLIRRGIANLRSIDFSQSSKRHFAVVTAILMLSLALAMILVLWKINQERAAQVPVGLVAVYALIVGSSTWVGLQTCIGTYYSPIVSRLICAGMVMFFCCDCTVGLGQVLTGCTPGIVVSSLTWMFYAPALVMLALSITEHQLDV